MILNKTTDDWYPDVFDNFDTNKRQMWKLEKDNMNIGCVLHVKVCILAADQSLLLQHIFFLNTQGDELPIWS